MSNIIKDNSTVIPLWGKQTNAALTHFAIGSELCPPTLLHAYGLLKRCAAQTHLEQGRLDSEIAHAIIIAAKELHRGNLDEQFPLSIWQSGSGTQTHMNVNEVLAGRANQLLSEDKQAHPNDHCNLGQSTNDTYPTALQISCALFLDNAFLPALEQLYRQFFTQAEYWQDCIKTGRTHLQDATPVSFGQVFKAYACQLKQNYQAIAASLEELRLLPMGGTAVGNGINTQPEFATLFCRHLSDMSGQTFSPAESMLANQATHNAIVQLSGSINTLASGLNKIASDLRLMASGPRCGLNEISLPANEPGSSIMPGKVNPSQCEMMNMVCAQVMGNHTTITIANAQGQLELNTFKPVIALNIIQSLQLLADAMTSFERYCISGIEVNKTQLADNLDKSLMLVTSLTPHIGYDKAASLAQQAATENRTLRDVVVSSGVMTAEEFELRVRPDTLIQPNIQI
jgi:fumarate hydratase class II